MLLVEFVVGIVSVFVDNILFIMIMFLVII